MPVCVPTIAAILAVLVAAMNVALLARIHCSLVGYRKYLGALRGHFTAAGRKAYGDEGERYRWPTYDVGIPISMGLVSLIGAAVVIFLTVN